MRKQPNILNDVSNAAAEPDGIPVCGGFFLDEHNSGGGFDQAVDHLECCCFARSASADQDYGFARSNTERDIVDERTPVDRISGPAKLNDRAHAQECTKNWGSDYSIPFPERFEKELSSLTLISDAFV